MIHLLRIIPSTIKCYGTVDPNFFPAELVKVETHVLTSWHDAINEQISTIWTKQP